MEEYDIRVAIVGGGIAGLTVALGLLNRGIGVKIYERGRSFREIGAGIGFTTNAEWAMKVMDPRVHAAFKRVTVQNGTDWFMWMDGESHDEEVIHKMYLGERGFEGCHRADFLDELVKMLPEGTVEFSKCLKTAKDDFEESDKPVMLEFTDGTRAEADAVIGCDGIRSRCRQLILGENSPSSYPSYSHKFAFRGLIPMEKALAVLGKEKTDTRHMYLGPNSHALTFPVAGGKLLNVVAFTTDHNEWVYPDRFTAPASRVDAIAAFAGFNSTVRSIIDLLPEQLDKWAVFDMHDHPASTFVKDRICISGDAAHASAPYHGAGAGFAIEDGAVLSHLIKLARDMAKAVPEHKSPLIRNALASYNAARRDRSLWLVETSRFVGEMYEWQNTRVGKNLGQCAQEIEWRSRKIWDYDINGMIEEAEKLFYENWRLASEENL